MVFRLCSHLVTFIITGMIVTLLDGFAQQRECILPVYPSDINFNQYYYFKNEFDSAYVCCMFGEFALHNQGSKKRLFITPLPGRYLANGMFSHIPEGVIGTSCQGRDSILARYARTDKFIIPATGSSSISFFRELSGGGLPCGKYKEPGIGTGGDNSAMMYVPNYMYNVGVNNIPDRTEFRVEIVRASDSTTLYVFDSVGVHPNPTYKTAYWYGTTPQRMFNERSLPSSLAGETVFIRIAPYRWGPTEFGMQMNTHSSYIFNYSASIEYQPGHSTLMTLAQVDSLYDVLWTRVQQYYDSTIHAKGRIPRPWESSKVPDKYTEQYYAKYFVMEYDSTRNSKHYKPKTFPQPQAKQSVYNESLFNTEQSGIRMTLGMSVFSRGADIPVSLYGSSRYTFSIVLVGLNGAELATLANGYYEGTDSQWRVPIGHTVLPETYFVVLKDAISSSPLAINKILVMP